MTRGDNKRARMQRAGKALKLLIGALCLKGSLVATQFYVGSSLTYHVANAKIFGTNPLKMFADLNGTIFETVVEDYYSRIPDVRQEENYYTKRFEALNPEITLLDKNLLGGGISLWVGIGQRTEKRFYYGCEVSLAYKHLSADIKDEQRIIFSESGEGVFYLRSLISGTISSTSSIAFSKHLEAALKLRLGFFSTDRFMGFITLGTSFHRNVFSRCRVDIDPQLKTQNLNEDYSQYYKDLWARNWRHDLTAQQYLVTTGEKSYASLNVGAGCDYFISKKTFLRLEYQYKFSFTNHLRFKHYTDITEDAYKAYAVRYQDGEHCLALGIGRVLP